ncbi:MAG: ABC transporter ATP-binding protein [Cardiobacteriaceae bacterium]|nr:ABC transporter ATP-binding protein [Cardiobacteriaceae bacterium]
MSDIAIEINAVTVRFNKSTEHFSGLKDYVIKLLKRQLMFQEFLALQNISLTVKKGESWALIGHNGAGKSTLLKLICKIVKPYQGSITVNGKIAPLIELSAGFDGDLTARENIYLNGALLGLNRKFMDKHFDAIIDFAELKDFVDTPVKNFSSGMSARLGFAIATISEPDILIIDEALSVGDADFQVKCHKRIQELLSGDTTFLFVSHDLSAAAKFCQKAIWLEGGKIKAIGDTKEIISKYQPDFIITE